ncbi:MAG: MGDG specific palmitate delta-7 desaturase [Monoraphidium minutum]|nr:MAG: MGDG specific palmitate delta-7 desaturase [Monoraphidium minutum]
MAPAEAYAFYKGCTDYDRLLTATPKPSRAAQANAKGASRIWGTDIFTKWEERPLLNVAPRDMSPGAAAFKNRALNFMRCLVLAATHVFAISFLPSVTLRKAVIAYLIYMIPGLFGITLCYHRMLTHRSFKTYKWFEYLCAWLGTQGGQGDPIEWVSLHRYHHLHTDTPLDPHSPYEGFWWSHILWLFKVEESVIDFSNAADLKSQFFYRFLEFGHFPLVFLLKPYLTYTYLGGWDAVAWTQAIPMVVGWHTTFLVNSACHSFGTQPFNTGDLSTNCWWVALLAFGEGNHNGHHAFPYSAKHGLNGLAGGEIDVTWWVICLLEKVGLVWDVQVPSEKVQAAKRAPPPAKAAAGKAARAGRTVDLTAKAE